MCHNFKETDAFTNGFFFKYSNPDISIESVVLYCFLHKMLLCSVELLYNSIDLFANGYLRLTWIQRKVNCFQDDPAEVEKTKSPAKRLGRLLTFTLRQHNSGATTELQQTERHEVPAILDIKWCHIPLYESPLFGVVNASGQLVIATIGNTDLGSVTTNDVTTVVITEQGLALSLDWSTGNGQNTG